MKKRTVTVVGGGQMGRALVGGMMASGFSAAEQITVVDPSRESRDWWIEHHDEVRVCESLSDSASGADVYLLAVKPKIIPSVAEKIGQQAGRSELIVSIAAGVSLSKLCECARNKRVIRVMPNTPSLVGAGASAFCAAAEATDEDCQWIEAALAGVGTVVRVDESQMDAVTGLSGSGPAYVCLVIEALADGGVLAGLPRPLAMELATQTVLGTAQMVLETRQHPAELKDAVASPGGTTIAALKVLEDTGLRSALIGAVQASAKRSKEMG